MGMTYVAAQVSRERHGRRRRTRLLVDTGAVYTILPTRVLKRLGVTPEWREEFEMANGEPMVRAVGRMYIHYHDRSAETFVIFGEPGDASVMGAYSLEGLRLEVDPRSEKVRPKTKFLLVHAAPA